MTKQNPREKRRVELSLTDAPVEVQKALYSLDGIQHGLTVQHIMNAIELIKAECGDDALISLEYESDWGSNQFLSWYQLETDEEVEKRIAKAEKAKKTAAETRKKKKLEAIKKEKEELQRLLLKYPKETNKR